MKKVLALTGIVVVFACSTSVAFAGEITGNGTLKTVNANSLCAYSGQEDLQWYTTNGDTELKSDPVKGDPAHSQNFGQVIGSIPGNGNPFDGGAGPAGCNPHDATGG